MEKIPMKLNKMLYLIPQQKNFPLFSNNPLIKCWLLLITILKTSDGKAFCMSSFYISRILI